MLAGRTRNALSYGLAQTPITVRGRGDANAVTIEVQNEGPPIQEGSLARLFKPMERDSKIQSGGNIGLGLYIVKQICVAHGGDISVRSSSEEGTTFMVELPVLAASAVSGDSLFTAPQWSSAAPA